MLELVLVLIVVFILIAIFTHHYSMKKLLVKTKKRDCELIRLAAESSIIASNTVNPMLALIEIVKAVQMIDSLHHRYGPHICYDITGVDTQELFQILQDQRDSILQDITNEYPILKTTHPLCTHAGYEKT